MKRYAGFLTGLAAAVMLAACSQKAVDSPSSKIDLNDPGKNALLILEVESSSYYNSSFAEYVRLLAAEDAQDLTSDLLSRLFDSFVEEKILLEAARQNDLRLSDQEKQQYFEALAQRIGEDTADMEEMDSQGILDKLLVEKLTIQLIAELQVSEEEIKAHYEQNKRDFLRSEMVKVSQILLDTEDKAVELFEQLKNGSEELFRSKARELSLGVESDKGGEMGLFELGQLPMEMEQMIFGLQKDQISRVFESSYGYHIFRLDDKISAELASLEDASEGIESLLLYRKIEAFMSGYVIDLKNKLDWKAFPDNLTFTYQRNDYEDE